MRSAATCASRRPSSSSSLHSSSPTSSSSCFGFPPAQPPSHFDNTPVLSHLIFLHPHPTEFAALVAQAQRPSTLRAYASHWGKFCGFIAAHDIAISDAAAIRSAAQAYIGHESTNGHRKAGWLRSAIAGITAWSRRLSGGSFLLDPEGLLGRAVQGASNANLLTVQAVDRAAPLPVEAVTTFYTKFGNATRFSDRRDAVLVVVAFFGLLRRKEVVGLLWRDVIDEVRGYRLLIHHAKSARHGEMQERASPGPRQARASARTQR